MYVTMLHQTSVKEGLYRIWCGANRLGDSGVHTLGDTVVPVMNGHPRDQASVRSLQVAADQR